MKKNLLLLWWGEWKYQYKSELLPKHFLIVEPLYIVLMPTFTLSASCVVYTLFFRIWKESNLVVCEIAFHIWLWELSNVSKLNAYLMCGMLFTCNTEFSFFSNLCIFWFVVWHEMCCFIMWATMECRVDHFTRVTHWNSAVQIQFELKV